MVVFGKKYLYLCKSDCIRAKVVVFSEKWLHSSKVVVFGQKWLYSGIVVVFGQSGCIHAKWLYSGKSC